MPVYPSALPGTFRGPWRSSQAIQRARRYHRASRLGETPAQKQICNVIQINQTLAYCFPLKRRADE